MQRLWVVVLLVGLAGGIGWAQWQPGIIHCHTKYSADGINTVEEIWRDGRTQGLKFVAITDHFDSLTPESLVQLMDECQELSSQGDPVLLPGVEMTVTSTDHLRHLLLLLCQDE